jgi:hypothetical protein
MQAAFYRLAFAAILAGIVAYTAYSALAPTAKTIRALQVAVQTAASHAQTPAENSAGKPINQR